MEQNERDYRPRYKDRLLDRDGKLVVLGQYDLLHRQFDPAPGNGSPITETLCMRTLKQLGYHVEEPKVIIRWLWALKDTNGWWMNPTLYTEEEIQCYSKDEYKKLEWSETEFEQ